MPEFLILSQNAVRYLRVEAQSLLEIASMLERDECWIVHSSSGTAHLLEHGGVTQPVCAQLPLAVRLAWWGARHPTIRLGFQIICWIGLGFAFHQMITRGIGWAFWLLLAGIANTLAWWWFESERGRLEPDVLRVRDR
jgi:hypothetical protein